MCVLYVSIDTNPVSLHDLSSGVGRTGALCLLYAAVQELEAGNSIPDLPLLVKKMRQQRKNMLQEKVRTHTPNKLMLYKGLTSHRQVL